MPRTVARDSDGLKRAREAGATLAFVNMMGGQDELVFDGDSIIVDAEGRLLARGPRVRLPIVWIAS